MFRFFLTNEERSHNSQVHLSSIILQLNTFIFKEISLEPKNKKQKLNRRRFDQDMASLTSIATPYPSSSQALRLKSAGNTLFSAGVRLSAMGSGQKTLKVRCTSTKPAAEVDWRSKRELLLEKRVRSVDVKEAQRLQKENNFVILDVRPEAEYKAGHPPGAINVEMYRLIREWTAWDIARRLGFAFFGIFSGTEENPEFIQSVEAKLDKEEAKIIVACSSAGTMKPTQNLPEGQQSRSLIAAYVLVLNGFKNVFHLEGGIYTWSKEGLPVETIED